LAEASARAPLMGNLLSSAATATFAYGTKVVCSALPSGSRLLFPIFLLKIPCQQEG